MNAATLAAFRAQGHTAREALRSSTVTLATVDYAAAVVAERIKRIATEQGYQQQQTIYVSVLKALLATQPALSTKLTYAGQVYDIEEVGGTKADEIAWTFTCRRWIKR